MTLDEFDNCEKQLNELYAQRDKLFDDLARLEDDIQDASDKYYGRLAEAGLRRVTLFQWKTVDGSQIWGDAREALKAVLESQQLVDPDEANGWGPVS
jgi:hypothetical protein